MKAACIKIFSAIFFLTGCFVFFNSCGLDTFYVIESPTDIIHEPSYNSSYDECYFSFRTKESSQSGGFSFDGTNVYYRIYDSLSKMQSSVSSLQNLALNSSDTAASSLIKTAASGGYGYRPLRSSDESSSILIENSGSDKQVSIRLTNYQDGDYKAYIRIGTADAGKPLRESGYSFDFGRNGSNDRMPVSGDADYSSSSSADNDKYVAMFAFAVGHDSAYSNYYSNILYLGSVKIDSSLPDN